MGFQDVLIVLQEVFPQVDYCMLEAVALQHSEDVNAALDFILNDVLLSPSASWPPEAIYSSDWGHQGVEGAHALWPSESELLSSGVACNYDFQVNDHMTCMEETMARDAAYESKTNGRSYLANFPEANSSVHPEEISREILARLISDHTNDSFRFKSNSMDETLAESDLREVSACSACSTNIHDKNGMQDKYTGPTTFNCAQDPFVSVLGKSIERLNETPSPNIIENDDDLSSRGNMSSLDVSSESSTIASGTDLFQSIKHLDDLTIDAKNSKVILASAMESTINMEKDLKLHEERAKQAKIEASLAGQDILVEVEELTHRLKLEKKINSMHAEEVYGERSILAAEARELESWLLKVSNEREKSLGIIDEIRKTLEARIASAFEELVAAKEEKREKERLAQKALDDGRLAFVSIVEETKKLQQEAEENSKLREALMNHGQTIDLLRLEIAAISSEIITLKETVDGHIPLSRSISSSRLGELCSSSLSVTSDVVSPSTDLSDCQMVPNEEKPRSPHPEIRLISSSQLADFWFSGFSTSPSIASDTVSPSTELPHCKIVPEEVTLKSPHSESRLLSSSQLVDLLSSRLSTSASIASNAVSPSTELPDCQMVPEEVTPERPHSERKININEMPSNDEEALERIDINEVPSGNEETLKSPHLGSRIDINEVSFDDEETLKSLLSEDGINIYEMPFDDAETLGRVPSENNININEVPSDDDNIADIDDWELLGEFSVEPTPAEMAA